MNQCEWIKEVGTGDLVLLASGKECGRIPFDSQDTKGSNFTLEDLKKKLESECRCS